MIRRVLNADSRISTSVFLLAGLLAGASAVSASQPNQTVSASIDTGLVMPTDRDGAVFGSLTIEGENRVQIAFERPDLDLDMEASGAPGLAIDGPLDILDRTQPDLLAPLIGASASARFPHTARPWVTVYEAGPVVSFHTSMTGVDRWTIQVIDSIGEVAMVFGGEGQPPAGVTWNGLKVDGEPAACGLTYSYVLEAYDKAGNKRRFVGDGFTLPAYRLDLPEGPVFLASGDQWRRARGEYPGYSPLALEAASRLNLHVAPSAPVVVSVTARTREEAEILADQVTLDIWPLLGGAVNRVVPVLQVLPGSPMGGTLRIGTSARP